MKFKIIILVLVLTVSYFFQADIVGFYQNISQRISKIGIENIDNFDKFKEDIAAIVNKESQIFAPPPLKNIQEVFKSVLTRQGITDETNLQRVQNGLPALTENAKLDNAAKAKARDMFDKQYFEHVSPSGKGPSELAEDAGYAYLIIGENLALGNFQDDKKLVEAWMNSPGHRANILNDKYTEIGVAAQKGIYEGRSVWVAVQEFGRPASACSAVDQTLKIRIDNYNAELDSLAQAIEVKKSELESLRKSNAAVYSQKVSEYNNLIKQYNDLVAKAKAAVAIFNQEVRAYNECLQ